MKRNFTVIVVGLGVHGGAVCHQLAKRGAGVLGIDRFDPPHPAGSSHGETRIIREAYFEHPSYVPLVQRAFELWDELAAEVHGVLFERTGAVMVGPAESTIVGGSLRSAIEHGISVEILEGEAISRRFPMLRGEGMVGVYEAKAGALDAEGCVAAHLVAGVAHGLEIAVGEVVLSWRRVGDSIEVRTNKHRYGCDRLVLCAGPWLPEIEPSLPLTSERQVMHWFEARYAQDSLTPPHCPIFLFDTPAGVFYGVPDLGSGVKVARHHGGSHSRSWKDGEGSVEDEEIDEVRGFLQSHVPPANGRHLRSTVCRYTNTPDGHFLIDRHPGEEQVWVVSACSGHGFKFAPAIGEAVAEQLLDGSSRADLSVFRWPR